MYEIDLRKHATKIINCNKKEVIPLTKEEENSYSKETNCYICKKEFINYKDDYDKKYCKVKDYCYYTGKYKGAAHNNCSLKYKVQKEILKVFHNGSTYDYHFIIKELAKEFNGNFECRCFSCKKNNEKDFNKELIKRFASTYKFCNNDLNRFIMLLRKGVYPYQYMDAWERFDETSLPAKESFYSSLTMENISDIDYRYGNNMFKKFKLNNLGEYHDLYVQSDTL